MNRTIRIPVKQPYRALEHGLRMPTNDDNCFEIFIRVHLDRY